MSEEEKKAIEYIKEFKNEVFEGVGNKSIMAKNIDILLNLIENQQKEIEELKQNRDEYKEEYIKLQNARYYNYISKDKIREKIKEYREETMRCQECKDYEDANINQRILLAFDKLLEE